MIEFTQEQLTLKAYELLKDKARILDMGCGIGNFVGLNPEKIEGYDNNFENVKHCKAKGYKVLRRDIRFLTLDEPKASFDGINCSHVLEHMVPEDAYKTICCMDWLLKPDGLLVIQGPTISDRFYDDFSHIKPYTPAALRHYFINKGGQRTYEDLRGTYVQEELIWRKDHSGFLIAFRKHGT